VCCRQPSALHLILATKAIDRSIARRALLTQHSTALHLHTLKKKALLLHYVLQTHTERECIIHALVGGREQKAAASLIRRTKESRRCCKKLLSGTSSSLCGEKRERLPQRVCMQPVGRRHVAGCIPSSFIAMKRCFQTPLFELKRGGYVFFYFNVFSHNFYLCI
jgi:hypothetical protein